MNKINLIFLINKQEKENRQIPLFNSYDKLSIEPDTIMIIKSNIVNFLKNNVDNLVFWDIITSISINKIEEFIGDSLKFGVEEDGKYFIFHSENISIILEF